MFEFLLQPWPWYISGPLISLVLLLLLGSGKTFGMSSNLRTVCAAFGAGQRISFFDFDWRSQRWNFIVILGAAVGGFIASHYLNNGTAMALNPETIEQLTRYGIQDAGSRLPSRSLIWFQLLVRSQSAWAIACGWVFCWFWCSLCWRMYLRARYHRTQQFAMAFPYRSNWFLYRGPLYQSIHFTLHPMIRTLVFFFYWFAFWHHTL